VDANRTIEKVVLLGFTQSSLWKKTNNLSN